MGLCDDSPMGRSLRTNSKTPSRFGSSCGGSPIGQTLRLSASTGNLNEMLRTRVDEYASRLTRSQDVNSCSLNRHTRVSHVVELPNRLCHEEAQTRLRATIDLGLMGSGSGSHAMLVADRLEDPNPAVRRRALWTLKRMTMPVLRPHLGAVAEKLSHKDAEVRALAAELMGAMSYAAEPYTKEVAHCLRDPDVTVRRSAIEALALCGKNGAVPHVDAIAGCLKDEDSTIRRWALTALGKIGRAGLPHSDLVIALLRDSDFRIRQAAIVTLSEMRRK